MAFTSIQCLNEDEELLFPQITFDQIIDSSGTTFKKTWEKLKKNILSSIYPIGSIIILESNIDPNELFDNMKWEKTSKGKILVGKGYLDNNTSSTLIEDDESISSEYAVQITTATMPSHNHKLYLRNRYLYSGSGYYEYKNSGTNSYTMYAGGGGYHSNVMPYICVNIWTRVADNNLDSAILDEMKLG